MSRAPEWAVCGSRVVPAVRVGVAPWEGVVRWGAGLFETIGCQDGAVLLLRSHLDRLRDGSRALGWGEPRLPGVAALGRLLHRQGLDRGAAALRLVAWTRRREVRVVGWAERYRLPRRLRRDGARLLPFTVPSGPLTGCKTTSYLAHRAALVAARRAGADAAVLVEHDGTVREADHATLFVRRGDRVFTPPAPLRCLPGVLRGWCLEAVPRLGWPVTEADLKLADAGAWDEAWLTSSLAGVVPVREVAGSPMRGPALVVPALLALGVPAPGQQGRRESQVGGLPTTAAT